MELKTPLLIYDADCPLCVRFKQGLERLDPSGRVTYHPLGDERVFTAFPQLDPMACRERIHYVKEDGTVLAGSDVVVELLTHFPGVEKFAWLIESGMGRKAVDFFHRTAEAARERLRHKDDCGTCPSEKR